VNDTAGGPLLLLQAPPKTQTMAISLEACPIDLIATAVTLPP